MPSRQLRDDKRGVSFTWRTRHAIVVSLALLLLPILLTIGARSGVSVMQSSVPILISGLFAVLAASERVTDALRPLLATLSLLTGGALLVWVAGGALVTHLVFIALVTVGTLYHDWLAYLVSVSYIWLFYVILGGADPAAIFAGLATETPYIGVVIAATATICATTGMISWLIADASQQRRTELETALAKAAERQHQAMEIHDNVVQGLATVVYALEAGDEQLANETAGETLENAKDLIGRLLMVEGADLSDLLDRSQPAQEGDEQ